MQLFLANQCTAMPSRSLPPLQKYRMYLKKIGGYSDKDKVDPDALQAIHEVCWARWACCAGIMC